MEWLAETGEIWLKTLAWLAGLAIAFGIAGRLMPCNPGMYWWKDLRAVLTDAVYWFIVPLFLRIGRTLMLIAGVLLLFGGREPNVAAVRGLPLWQQCLAVLLIQDVLLYWIHRAFHTRAAWKFHAVHHSPTVLDWMSVVRFHPVNTLLAFSLADVAVLLLGFAPAAVVVLAPFNVIYSAMVHANLNWTFGPLRYVLASPVFHRWHHTTREEGLDKNFAPTFPFLDLLFGTFYMPAGRLPEQFGTGEPYFPEGFWGQFLHPFRDLALLAWARRRPAAAALTSAGVLALLGLLSAGVYSAAGLAARNEQLAREVLRAEASQHALQLDLALRALADNDLVRATALLDAVAAPFQQTAAQRHLRELCRRKCLVLTGHAGAFNAVAVSGDGRTVFSAGEDGTVKVWDAGTGQERLTLAEHTRPVRGVAVSGDGRVIVSASHDGTLKVWDAGTGREKATLAGHAGAVLAVALSADGQVIVSGGVDSTARVWDAETGRQKLRLDGHGAAVPAVAISADGRRVVSAASQKARVWDARTGRQEHDLEGHADLVYSLALSPDGHCVVSGGLDEQAKVWDAETGRQVRTLTGQAGPVYAVTISADGRRILSGGGDRTVRVWDAATGRARLTLQGHRDAVTAVAVSADGRRIVSGGRDGAVAVWDAEECGPD